MANHDYERNVEDLSENIQSIFLRDSNDTLTVTYKNGTETVYDCPEIVTFSHRFVLTCDDAYNASDNSIIENLVQQWLSDGKLTTSS